MKASTIVLAFVVLALLVVAGCSSIPSAGGERGEEGKASGQHHGTPSVIYKDTRPRPLTGYANVERPTEQKWW